MQDSKIRTELAAPRAAFLFSAIISHMIIKGKNVILRPIVIADAPRFVKWLSDPEVNQFTSRRKISLKDELKWIRGLKKDKTDKDFAIDTKNGVHIGSVGIYLDKQDRGAKFGILIGDKRYWNRGLGTEATKLILEYGFKKLKVHRIQLAVYSYNKKAIAIYRKLGFRLEGKSREGIFYIGKFYDEYHMGLLRKEWFRLKK